MPARALDRRLARTRGLLLDAFSREMVERGFERMTVQHLLDRSGVGRSTFYSHFKGKDDLLEASLRRLQSGLRAAWDEMRAQSGSAGAPLGFSRAFFRHVDGHRRIYDLVAGKPSEVTLDRHMRRMLTELVLEDVLRRPRARRGSKAAEVAAEFVSGALWSLMVWWISTRSRLSADDLDAHFRRLTLEGLEGVFGPGTPLKA